MRVSSLVEKGLVAQSWGYVFQGGWRGQEGRIRLRVSKLEILSVKDVQLRGGDLAQW